MTCIDVEQRDIAERYLGGALAEAEADAYERHYFECARCYGELEALRTIREAFDRRPSPARFARHRAWLGLAAAFVLAASGAIAWSVMGSRATPQPTAPPAATAERPADASPAQALAQLAVVTPPPYVERRLRGVERPDFSAGMQRYAAGDFAAAIPRLERALRREPSAEDARFYLGASQLLVRHAAEAVPLLRVLAARAASPYAEEAQFLIAKAHLQSGDASAALEALDRTIAMHGDREADASALRARVAAVVH